MNSVALGLKSVQRGSPHSSRRGPVVSSADIERIGAALFEQLRGVLTRISLPAFASAVELLLEAYARRGRFYIMGNGGSAATATHLASDLVKSARVPGEPPARAFALADNLSLFSAWANDETYDDVFGEQLAAVLDPGDIVIAISASGNSPNILRGLSVARASGAKSIGLFGFEGGAAMTAVDIALLIDSRDFGVIESAHLAIGHAIVEAFRREIRGRACR